MKRVLRKRLVLGGRLRKEEKESLKSRKRRKFINKELSRKDFSVVR